MQRRKFSRECEVDAVRMILEPSAPATQAARDLDMHVNVLRKWVKEISTDPGQAFPGHGPISPSAKTAHDLRRPLAQSRNPDEISAAVSRTYDGDIQMIDASSIRVHQPAANTREKPADPVAWLKGLEVPAIVRIVGWPRGIRGADDDERSLRSYRPRARLSL